MSWKTGVNLRERMAAMELEYSRKNCWFLTLTIPGGDAESFESVARFSSYAIDRINRELNRFFEGNEMSRCSVWEYQKRGALHVHILIGCHRIHAMDIEKFRLKMSKVWFKTLLAISKKRPCNPFISSKGNTRSYEEIMAIDDGIRFSNCQVVKKSVIAYLSSYLSESNHQKDFKNKQGLRKKFYPIATWAQWNRNATKLFHKYSEKIDLGDCPVCDLVSVESAFLELEKTVPRAEGTEVKYPRNPYVKGFYVIVDRESPSQWKTLKEVVWDELSYLFDDRFRYQDYLSRNCKGRDTRQKLEPLSDLTIEEELQLRAGILSMRLQERQRMISLGIELAYMGTFMLELMKEKEDILSSKPYFNYTQLELDCARKENPDERYYQCQ